MRDNLWLSWLSGYRLLTSSRGADLSNATDQSNFHFEFNSSIDEDRFFRTLLTKRLKAHVDRRGFWIITLIVSGMIIAVSWIGLDQGWLTSPTIFALLICFLLGQIYMAFLTTWSTRRIFDKLHELDGMAQMTWRVTFDDLSILVRTPNIESRMSWDTIAEVGDTQVMVVIWYNTKQGFFIPASVFADSAARTAFAEWASKRLRSATALSSVIKSV